MVVDEAYKALHDEANPNVYTRGIDEEVDKLLDEIKHQVDSKPHGGR